MATVLEESLADAEECIDWEDSGLVALFPRSQLGHLQCGKFRVWVFPKSDAKGHQEVWSKGTLIVHK